MNYLSNGMSKSKFFATTKDDVSKAAVDFFSIGHILMGQIFFFIVYALLSEHLLGFWDTFYGVVYGFFPNSDVEGWAVAIAIGAGIIWEPIENTILWKMGLKFEGKLDSILNVVFDILFVTLGAFLARLINFWQINLILVIVEMIAFFIIRWYVTTKL
ncbi:MAG: DUF2585 family protein [archaeon]|nr:DUF2585 family protein [archaeon]